MHYRWNFDDQNLAFLESEFSSGLFPRSLGRRGGRLLRPLERADAQGRGRLRGHARVRCRSSRTPSPSGWRCSAPTWPTTRTSWGAARRSATTASWRPCGPTCSGTRRRAALIKQTAPRVGRWVERMNTTEPHRSEYQLDHGDEALIADDAVPDTLAAMLAFVADEYLPEITAHVAFANEWLADRPDLEVGHQRHRQPGPPPHRRRRVRVARASRSRPRSFPTVSG